MIGRVPAFAKLAPVTPIYEKGDNTDTANYRPSLVSPYMVKAQF